MSIQQRQTTPTLKLALTWTYCNKLMALGKTAPHPKSCCIVLSPAPKKGEKKPWYEYSSKIIIQKLQCKKKMPNN